MFSRCPDILSSVFAASGAAQPLHLPELHTAGCLPGDNIQVQGPASTCTHSQIQTAASKLASGGEFIKRAANDPSSLSVPAHTAQNNQWIPDIAWPVVVCSILPKDNGTDKPPRHPDGPQEILTYQAFVTATSWGQHPVLTKSMRSLRFFSICCGGRRLIKSKAQSSCWSLCRNKKSPWSQGGQVTQLPVPSSDTSEINSM